MVSITSVFHVQSLQLNHKVLSRVLFSFWKPDTEIWQSRSLRIRKVYLFLVQYHNKQHQQNTCQTFSCFSARSCFLLALHGTACWHIYSCEAEVSSTERDFQYLEMVPKKINQLLLRLKLSNRTGGSIFSCNSFLLGQSKPIILFFKSLNSWGGFPFLVLELQVFFDQRERGFLKDAVLYHD